MRSAIIILGGLALAALFVFGARFFGQTAALGAKIFIPLWFIAAAMNMWMGVARAGYSFMEELPIFLVIFAVPAAAAVFVWWKYS